MATDEKTQHKEERPIGAWTPFRHGVFRMLWIAILFVNIASWMQDVGAGWLMTSLAPTPVMVSLVQAATSTPFFLLAIPAGAMADIVDRRRFLIGTQVWMACCAGLLGILTLTGVTGSFRNTMPAPMAHTVCSVPMALNLTMDKCPAA